MDVDELIKMAKINRNMRTIYLQVLTVRFSFAKILRNFMPRTLFAEFRAAQLRSDTVLSGSAVLQFFAERDFGDVDLDIYVSQSKSRAFLAFMQENFDLMPTVPNARQPPVHDPASFTGDSAAVFSSQHNADYSVVHHSGYVDGSIGRVVNFVYNNRIIQVISCIACPLETIMRFHSTIVMNVVTATHAYCLYPKATMIANHGLINGPLDEDIESCLQKYTQRGCDSSLIPHDNIAVSSWELWYNRFDWTGETSYSVFAAPRLSHPLVFCDVQVKNLIRQCLSEESSSSDDDYKNMDAEITPCIKGTFSSHFSA
ncbi:hypothetical protein CVT24_001410 [Panaeolus cyanescens]|uniref:Uncharacterized protein n=1 Tax=Panaeolus cyanescens TaxID=181874 RepID=A0A409WIQ3_9AGAR|nr:hypothetical protein CVT24_001410 [Panaeolus cyanescens]